MKLRLSQHIAIAIVVSAAGILIALIVAQHYREAWLQLWSFISGTILLFCHSLQAPLAQWLKTTAQALLDREPRKVPVISTPVTALPAPDTAQKDNTIMAGFNVFSQLFGSQEGHKINQAVDSTLNNVVQTIPGGSQLDAVVTSLAHPAGTASTITTTNSDGTSTVIRDIEIAGKVIGIFDPEIIAQLDEAINKALAYAAADEATVAAVTGYLNGWLEKAGLPAPTLIGNAVAK